MELVEEVRSLQTGARNLARGRPACQSSIYSHPIIPSASKATDGNCDGDFFHGSCTHTSTEKEPWWHVDLGEQFAISTVVVKNREDCCSERLLGAEIHVGDSVADHGKSNPLCDGPPFSLCSCGNITDTRRGSFSSLNCHWLKGRYVSVNLPGHASTLTLCEVEVYGTKLGLTSTLKFRLAALGLSMRCQERRGQQPSPGANTSGSSYTTHIWMLLTWISMLTLALLAGRGEAQSCKPELRGIAHNLAKGRPAFQSSIYRHEIFTGGIKAVDGNCDGLFNSGSCTHTNQDQDPWWYVDLGDQYAISAVVVKNRQGCCSERLLGAEIRIGDSVSDHGKSNSLCGTVTDTSLGSVSTLYCNWLKGRYVSVNIQGRAEYLTLCEVEVYGTKLDDQCHGMLITWTWSLALALLAARGDARSCMSEWQSAHNLAKGRPAFQSSIYRHEIFTGGIKAVDGNCNAAFSSGSCTHTQKEKDPWWYVDLGDEYAISTVLVKNRQDCCGNRLQGAEIRVGNAMAHRSKSNSLCGTITDNRSGSISVFNCDWLKGRYVSVQIPDHEEYLTLCEVEVYGIKAEDQC
ncbi:uncharacterized protein LOC117050501 [Lacerta agilis]|uniref:uncharacterized protein LOC117050501 n=1 Tax=Lacerta agilis TaxID=80427 RepID=UPI0014195982|nr:uncharacterized protein LOC117050501 [Lacerta agilis]